MLYVLICGHASHAPDLAFVLACGSLMQLRIRILSSALLASAFEMSTLRPWPRHTSALCCAGVQHDPSAFFTDERFRGSKSVLPMCQLFTRQKRKIHQKKGKDPSWVRHSLKSAFCASNVGKFASRKAFIKKPNSGIKRASGAARPSVIT